MLLLLYWADLFRFYMFVTMILYTLLVISEIVLAVLTVHRVSMVTHQGPLLELGALWTEELPPPGPGGAHAQQVGGAGGGHVCIVARG